MTVIGLAEELKKYKIAVNALWPQTAIETAAVRNILGGEELIQCSRIPEIMADAASFIVQKPSNEFTGNFYIDEDVLRDEGVVDFDKYAVDNNRLLFKDLFID